MQHAILIFLGGGIGSLLRFLISHLFKEYSKSNLPMATLFANAIACMVLATTLWILSSKINYSEGIKAFVVIGFCGGLSTFSTFSMETIALLKNHSVWMAGSNIVLNLVSCLGIMYLFWPESKI